IPECCLCESPFDCDPSDGGMSPNLLYMGTGSAGGVPVLQYNLSELTSFDSEFEIRTLDPEGIIFFGDIGTERNWFLLAVHQGYLRAQTVHEDNQVIVSTGTVISDGQWKTVQVSKQERGIFVNVGGATAVKMEQSRESQVVELGGGLLRIAIGALMPNGIIDVGLNPALDGCLRNWDWVKQDSSILQHRVQESDAQRCWEHIGPGSFFPGEAVACLPLQGKNNRSYDWWIMKGGRLLVIRGVLFAIVDPQNKTSCDYTLLSDPLYFGQELVLHFRGKVLGSGTLSSNPCSMGSHNLELLVMERQFAMKMGTEQGVMQLDQDDLEHLKSIWSHSGSRLYLGGQPGGSSFFHGCLQVKIQGTVVDVDLAEVKHTGIRSHSCPSTMEIRDQK
uniref:Laminin G domain-containing protein n=1 Tax=Scleropages formosus TaxID=113540 RepID=A0A8C9RZB1_SCLFO